MNHSVFVQNNIVLPQSVIYKAAISITRLKNISLWRFFKFVEMSRFFYLLLLKTFSYFYGTENEGEVFIILFEEIHNYMEIFSLIWVKKEWV